MRQIEMIRKRVDTRGQWMQMGIAAATVVTPLISRWQALRSAERARAIREEAQSRLAQARRISLPGRLFSRQTPPVAEVVETLTAKGRNKSVTRLWLAGVGVGLVAAGTGAYFLVRRRMAATADEPMMDLPVVSMNGNGGQMRDLARATVEVGASRSASSAPTSPAPSPMENTTPTNAGAPTDTAADTLPNGATSVDADETLSGVVNAEEAPFIGNIRTMIYHESDADNLPAEENRIYFASEAEARSAGYRRDRDEVTPGDSSASFGSETER